MKVAILTGGKGTRLGLKDLPKPMAPLAGQMLLERIVECVKDSGLDDLIFLNGHLAEKVEAHFGDGSAHGVRITHVCEREALGTAGSVRAAAAHLTEPFILLYGDILLDVDLAAFADWHGKSGALATIFVHPNNHPHDSDLVEVAGDRVRRFLPKPHAEGAILPNLVSAAIYVLDPRALEYVPASGPSDWGGQVFPAMAAAGVPIAAYRSVEYAKDMGTPERLMQGEKDLASGKVAALRCDKLKPALFLDRDGVLNVEINGVHRPEDLRLTPGAGEAVARLNAAGVPAICITNQPDVAKGFLTPDTLGQVFAALDSALAAQGRAYLDDLFHCPHHPEAGWPGELVALKVPCDCRKPAPGLLLQAAARHNIDLSRSWFVGDRATDVAAACAAGVRSILLQWDNGAIVEQTNDCFPDHKAASLAEAVDHVLKELGK